MHTGAQDTRATASCQGIIDDEGDFRGKPGSYETNQDISQPVGCPFGSRKEPMKHGKMFVEWPVTQALGRAQETRNGVALVAAEPDSKQEGEIQKAWQCKHRKKSLHNLVD